MRSKLVRRLYRSFLRQVCELNSPLIIQSIPNISLLQNYRFYLPEKYTTSAINKICDSYLISKTELDDGKIEKERLIYIVRRCFNRAMNMPLSVVDAAISEAFDCLRNLTALQKQNLRTSVVVTHTTFGCKVRITCSTLYGGSSYDTRLEEAVHTYPYRIQVENCSEGDKRVQLLGRHWIFENAHGEAEAVVEKYGRGVIGTLVHVYATCRKVRSQ